MKVLKVSPPSVMHPIVKHHYLHRRPPATYAFALVDGPWEDVVGALTIGCPPSHQLRQSVCPSNPSAVLELNRLWVSDSMPTNTESWFVARALRTLPPLILVSYADTAHGHYGYIYRAMNWHYAGWTDMERKTPRFDYVVPGKHSRDAFRAGGGLDADRVRRAPKAKYWTTTGNRRDRRVLEHLVAWPQLDWKQNPVPGEPVLTAGGCAIR